MTVFRRLGGIKRRLAGEKYRCYFKSYVRGPGCLAKAFFTFDGKIGNYASSCLSQGQPLRRLTMQTSVEFKTFCGCSMCFTLTKEVDKTSQWLFNLRFSSCGEEPTFLSNGAGHAPAVLRGLGLDGAAHRLRAGGAAARAHGRGCYLRLGEWCVFFFFRGSGWCVVLVFLNCFFSCFLKV